MIRFFLPRSHRLRTGPCKPGSWQESSRESVEDCPPIGASAWGCLVNPDRRNGKARRSEIQAFAPRPTSYVNRPPPPSVSCILQACRSSVGTTQPVSLWLGNPEVAEDTGPHVTPCRRHEAYLRVPAVTGQLLHLTPMFWTSSVEAVE